MLSHILRELILPPSSLIIAAAVGLYLLKSRPKIGKGLIAGVLVIFYLLSIPVVSHVLSRSAEGLEAMNIEDVRNYKPDVIVVLGGGARHDNPEYGGESMPSSATLSRLRYASWLAGKLGCPLIVSGGYGETPQESEAATMSATLKEWGHSSKVFLESKSHNTRENAKFSQEIIEREGFEKVLVVTSAPHAARAQATFQKLGMNSRVASTGFRRPGAWERGPLLFIPAHGQFDASCYALRTHLASIWYWLRY